MQTLLIRRMTNIFMLAFILAFASLASAEPSLQDINQLLKHGDIQKADTLMKEVISAHPDSAKAHFKYSEILAAEGKLDEARVELSTAEKLEPKLAFAKPAAVKALNQKLYKSDQSGYHSTNPFVTWAAVAFVVIFITVIIRAIRRPQIQPNYANAQTPNGYNPQTPYQNGPYQNSPQAGGMGSNIASSLATGAAIGAGVVAGEMLMHKMLDDDHPASHDSYTRNQPAPDNFDEISGDDFVDNDNGSWDSDSSSDSDSSGGDWS